MYTFSVRMQSYCSVEWFRNIISKLTFDEFCIQKMDMISVGLVKHTYVLCIICNTKIRIQRGNSYQKNEKVSRRKAQRNQMNTWKLSTFSEVFVKEKRIYVWTQSKDGVTWQFWVRCTSGRKRKKRGMEEK